MEQVEQSDGDGKLNAAALMLMQLLVLLALVVQMVGRKTIESAEADGEPVAAVRRYHLEVTLPRITREDQFPLYFLVEEKVRYQLLADGAPVFPAPVTFDPDQAPPPVADDRHEVRATHRRRDDTGPDRTGRESTVALDVTLKGDDGPQVLELVVAVESPPLRLADEIEAYWGAVAKRFDERAAQPPARSVTRDVYATFNYPKARFGDLQAATDEYLRAPAANVLIHPAAVPLSQWEEMTTRTGRGFRFNDRAVMEKHVRLVFGLWHRSWPAERAWLDDFFAPFGTNWDRTDVSDPVAHFGIPPKPGPEAAPRAVRFYYRLAVTLPPPAEGDGPPGRPVVRLLPTANVPPALRAGGTP